MTKLQYLKRLLMHILVYAILILIGTEVNGWIMIQQFGASSVGVMGIMFGWPALIFAAIYTEYQIKKSKELK